MKDRLVLSPIEAAYIAGIFDGEGYVGIWESGKWSKRNFSPRFVITLTITNTSARMLNWIHDRVGGNIRISHLAGQYKATKTCYKLAMYGGRAVELLRVMFPYLLVKKEQAEIVFKLKEITLARDPRVCGISRTRLTEAELEERRELTRQIKEAKRTIQ